MLSSAHAPPEGLEEEDEEPVDARIEAQEHGIPASQQFQPVRSECAETRRALRRHWTTWAKGYQLLCISLRIATVAVTCALASPIGTQLHAPGLCPTIYCTNFHPRVPNSALRV